ncbi:foldase protein PrsA [Paenibacillus sp. DS2015]|uniref:peptidylprolyl isomerase n=1 Tax=Paenibacillus sp. DS2015 TaxID=3373917 RepID=UPI003D1E0A20
MMRTIREGKTLWAVNVILVLSVLLMGGLILFRGLGPVPADQTSSEEEEPVASVNGEFITEEEWSQELKRRYGQDLLLHMLNRMVVFEEAKARHISTTPEEVAQELLRNIQGYDSEEAYYQQMMTELGLTRQDIELETAYRLVLEKIATSGIDISDQDIDQYLAQNSDQYAVMKQMKLSLIKVNSSEEAEKIMDELEKGSDFSQMARERSLDMESRSQGGKLGVVEEGDPFLPKELMDTASTLEIGDIAGPFLWEGGYAVIQLTDIMMEEKEDPRYVRESIRKQLALNEATPLSQLEQELRHKYQAHIMSSIPSS